MEGKQHQGKQVSPCGAHVYVRGLGTEKMQGQILDNDEKPGGMNPKQTDYKTGGQ